MGVDSYGLSGRKQKAEAKDKAKITGAVAVVSKKNADESSP
jgi:hypothetical protein